MRHFLPNSHDVINYSAPQDWPFYSFQSLILCVTSCDSMTRKMDSFMTNDTTMQDNWKTCVGLLLPLLLGKDQLQLHCNNCLPTQNVWRAKLQIWIARQAKELLQIPGTNPGKQSSLGMAGHMDVYLSELHSTADPKQHSETWHSSFSLQCKLHSNHLTA